MIVDIFCHYDFIYKYIHTYILSSDPYMITSFATIAKLFVSQNQTKFRCKCRHSS